MDCGILITISSCYADGEKGYQLRILFSLTYHFWVQVWGVPFELMTEDTGRDIRNRIGNFLEANKRSWQLDQAKYMRVRVELPLNKPLHRGGYLMSVEGEKLWDTFKYGRLPTVCYIYGRLGHDDRHCVATETRQVMKYQYGD